MNAADMHSQPGKTAPRFIQDLLSYDPRIPPKAGRNVLTDPAPQYEEDTTLPQMIYPGSCRHSFMTQREQSILPKVGQKLSTVTSYRVAALCQDCRCHLDLRLEVGGGRDRWPCPSAEYPLHHLRHVPSASAEPLIPIDTAADREGSDAYVFKCSAPKCPAVVTVRVSPPRLAPKFVDLITNKKLISDRTDAAIREDPERFEGHSPPPPIQVLSDLKQYMSDSKNQPDIKRVAAQNKRFMKSLGEPCRELLEYLGFRYSEQDEETGRHWTLPQPDRSADAPLNDPTWVRLDDVEKELMILIDQRPSEEKRGHNTQFMAPSSIRDIEGTLGCLDYSKVASSRRTVDLTVQEHPYYASLGATSDFADELLIYAYKRQTDCDPANIPYYLECLQDIAKGRQSETLQIEVTMQVSAGQVSRKDVRDAYAYFGLPPTASLDDEHIIGLFKSRIADAPKQEEEARSYLRTIGQVRGSEIIERAVSNTITTYDQALSWLGAELSTPDEFIVTMFTLKTTENPNDAELARHVVSLIAEQRNSEALRSWLSTGDLGEVEMDIGQAYTRLGIEDRSLDDDMIITTFNIRAEETPSQLGDLRMALKAIAKEKESRRIESFLNSGQLSSEPAPADWPVGLENIGNTCYLNSLLQFYFTVKPLRELILNIDQFKMEMSPENLRNKRVGSRKVSAREVERAQKFAHELRKLFQSLISAPTSSITPELELARLTLMTNDDCFRRRSTIGKDGRPSLGDINGAPISGPLGPPAPSQEMEIDSKITEEPTKDTVDDGASDVTLVNLLPDDGDIPMTNAEETEHQKEMLEDKENMAPTKGVEAELPPHQGRTEPLGNASPSKVNEQEQPHNQMAESQSGTEHNGAPPTPPSDDTVPPGRPPPIPPRPKPAELMKKVQEEVELGAQHDVTEVIANVAFQLQCAIKPEKVDTDGEQIDRIKRLFFGKTRSYIEQGGNVRMKEEFFLDIKVDVAAGPRDIYSALDGAFDVQSVNLDGSVVPQYSSISQLPPILQIQVQRVQFDAVKKTSYKSVFELKLEETIYLDRYMDDGAELIQRRESVWQWKDELRKLESRRDELTTTELGMPVPEMLELTKKYLTDIQTDDDTDEAIDLIEPLEIDPWVIEALGERSNEIKAELAYIDTSIKTIKTQISSQFTDLRNLPYRLHSVFIHRGSVSFGHYWIFIYDFKRGIWRKYNDGYVTDVKDPQKEIFHQEEYNPATPYFLVYVRDKDKDRLVDAVCRDVPPQPQNPENHDTSDKMDVRDVDGVDEKAGDQQQRPRGNDHVPGSWSWDNAGADGVADAW
ncbi:MAG: hypothetical protein M1819_000589 [Sarea resinae]|nr:MAG: hypothetical protein M1819_000589 [Sarea resinae]